jgi:hypothetical protein
VVVLVVVVVGLQHLLNIVLGDPAEPVVLMVVVVVVVCFPLALAEALSMEGRAVITHPSLAVLAEQTAIRPPLAGMVVLVLVVAAAVGLRRQV